MYSKDELRSLLNELSKYIKLSVFAKEYGVNQSSLSRFLNSEMYAYMVSLDKINGFYNYVIDNLRNLT